MTKKITTGGVFDVLELEPGEAEALKIKAVLFDAIVAYIKENNLTQEQAAKKWGYNALALLMYVVVSLQVFLLMH